MRGPASLEIQAALDYFAPPVERVMERANPGCRVRVIPCSAA